RSLRPTSATCAGVASLNECPKPPLIWVSMSPGAASSPRAEIRRAPRLDSRVPIFRILPPAMRRSPLGRKSFSAMIAQPEISVASDIGAEYSPADGARKENSRTGAFGRRLRGYESSAARARAGFGRRRPRPGRLVEPRLEVPPAAPDREPPRPAAREGLYDPGRSGPRLSGDPGEIEGRPRGLGGGPRRTARALRAAARPGQVGGALLPHGRAAAGRRLGRLFPLLRRARSRGGHDPAG